MSRLLSCKPNYFCYICGLFTPSNKSRPITNLIKERYNAYFYPVKLGDQDKPYAPHRICFNCANILSKWSSNGKVYFSFDWPMSWREQKDHENDCYFCGSMKNGFNSRRRKKLEAYSTVSSVTKTEGNGSRKPNVCTLSKFKLNNDDLYLNF